MKIKRMDIEKLILEYNCPICGYKSEKDLAPLKFIKGETSRPTGFYCSRCNGNWTFEIIISNTRLGEAIIINTTWHNPK